MSIIENTKSRIGAITCTLLLSSLSLQAQDLLVKGVVKDSSGLAIIGANVVVNGTTTGTVTDVDGNFSLRAKQGDQILVTYIGFKEQLLAAKTVMNITLSEDTQVLEDVVVIGYGAVRKKELTGAVTQVKSEDLSNQLSSDLGSALQGMVSGVSVTAESGAPGAGSSILIRGVSSINGGNTPLYVVDGVPQEGDPRISMNEIETLDILKDAASCAIYGTRGAAGVILITTKQGKEGKLKVTADATYGVRKITSTDYLMDATEQTYFDLTYKRSIGGGNGVIFDDKTTLMNLVNNPSYFHNNTQLIDDVFIDNAATQNYSVNLSGGQKGVTYSVVAGFYDQEGSIVNSGFNRLNTRGNLAYTNKRFRVNASFGVNAEQTEKSASNILLQAIKYYPTQRPLTLDDSYETTGGAEQERMSDILDSFFSEDNQEMTNAFANFNANYEIFDGFKISGRVAMNYSNGYRKQFRPYKEVIKEDGTPVTSPTKSYVAMTSIHRNSLVWDFGAQYQKQLHDHKITALAAITGEEYNFEGFMARREGVLDNNIDNLDGTSLNPEVGSSDNYTNILIGTIGRLQYDWKGRYLLSASVRVDGSSKFEKNNRWGFFPSASAAWNVSDEPFFEPLQQVVNNFKIRGSYGTTGNQSFTPYSYAAVITSGYDYVTGTGVGNLGLGSIQTSYANELVKWEVSKQTNVGIDLAFLQNKLTLTAEYYTTAKEDMLFPVTLPGSTGTSAKLTMNVGNMINEGVEIAAGYKWTIGDFNMNLNGTFSTNRNEITRMSGSNARISAYTAGLIQGAPKQSQVTFIAEGYEAGALFVYQTEGVINTDEKLARYQKLNSAADYGDLMFKDVNGDGIISDDDRVYAGSGIPKYEVGLNLSLEYKGFDFYANLFSAMGHKIVNGAKATAYTFGRHKDLIAAYGLHNIDSPIPTYRGDLTEHDNYRADTDLWVEDGSYFRVKNITLGYTIPSRVTSKWNISKLRVYLTAQNLLTLTDYTGYDPEIGGGISTRGMDMGNYPTTATFTGGVNLAF